MGEVYKRVARPEIWQVLPRSQGERIGLKPGDLLLSYNGRPVETNDDVRKAQALALGSEGKIPLVVLRGEKELEFSVQPGPLGGMPVVAKYPSSLALALEDIMRHFGLFTDYDWLAALSGESFTFTAKADECRGFWSGGKSGDYLESLGHVAGLSFRKIINDGTGKHVKAIMRNRNSGRIVLVHGGWPGHRSGFWGVATRYSPKDSIIYGYSMDSAEEMPLLGPVKEIFVTKPAGSWQEPAKLLGRVLKQALELNQVYSDTGWKSGMDAYNLLITSLDTLPFCPVCGVKESQVCFDRLIYTALAHKQSAQRFLEGMKLALPNQADVINEALADNQAIIGKFYGITRSSARIGRLQDQRKLGMVINAIQLIENDLIGDYEDILGRL